MDTLALILFVSGASLAVPSPSPTPANYYLAEVRHMKLHECIKLWSTCPECDVQQRAALRVNFGIKCKHNPEISDVITPCKPGYHLDRQLSCRGAVPISAARMICHADADRGVDEPCGVECAWGTKMLPPR